ncbi:MAG TPA: DUF1501 domain-containing protein [Bryobacterales bacterium]|nr:DUF1501 domain-containing protein [Bryobacterales bacterium]
MNSQEKFDRFITRYPHDHTAFWKRPEYSRRQWFQLLGAGVTGYFVARPAALAQAVVETSSNVSMQNKARNVIFILLYGAPSHIDTFDFKQIPGVTPADFAPSTVNGLLFPVGLMPNIAQQLGNIAIVRSVRSWSAVHGLAQTWTQIGRNPVSALGKVAPHIGSVVAIEKEPERRPGQVFPGFLALNVGSSPGAGYFPASFAPFQVTPSAAGLANTTHPGGVGRFQDRLYSLYLLDDPLRKDSPLGKPPEEMDAFYHAARDLMYNPVVDQAFGFSAADSMRYGSTSFGNACLVAQQVLAANQGTRFIQINLGSWDMHSNIYNKNAAGGLYKMSQMFDNGFSALLSDLQSSGMLDQTLVVALGEFGRTVGPLTPQGGRDHHLQQFALFAGGGVQGGSALGATNGDGSATADPGWSRQRDVKPEDIEATIYTALGINWTILRYDDPFKRGFEYVPFSKEDAYGPINELWAT